MTYEELCSFEVLYKAYLEARKGKRSKSKTIEYEAQALACTEKLSRKLAVRDVRQPGGDIRQQICYVPSKFEVFAVYEPKRRMVHAPAFVDKVVLHALVDNILYDALTRSFIRDSHASQTGKGTDDGLMRLKTHMVDYYRREGHGADGWVLFQSTPSARRATAKAAKKSTTFVPLYTLVHNLKRNFTKAPAK